MSHEKKNKFDIWNVQKQSIDICQKIRYVHTREVWNLALGVNIGDEQNGGSGNYRPVLVLKVFNKNLFLGVPLRIFDTNRLSKKMGMIHKDEFLSIKKTIKEWFD